MRKYREKKIFLNNNHSKYCIVRVFYKESEMRAFYKRHCEERGLPDPDHFQIKGVSLHYEKISGRKLSPETGMVLFSLENCGAGVVTHELLHAILWAHKHKANKQQYPIVIKDMKEEEQILSNHTYAVMQFYRWYWKLLTQMGQ